MRHSVAAMAVVSRPKPDGGTGWLVQWNPKWLRFNLVGGHKRSDETFRECCEREVMEELAITPVRDFTTAHIPLACIEYDAWSVSANEMTRYTFELFRVEFTRPEVVAAVTSAVENRWLTEVEISQCRTTDGLAVSETAGRVLSLAGLFIPPS